MSQNRMELIEVQHCLETVSPTNVQDFNSKAFFLKIYAPPVITQNVYVIKRR